MANGNGGWRPGAGRKKKVDEERVRDLAIKAIVDVHGSEENGFKALLRSNEPVLVKWVYEHGYGKPTEHIDMTTRTEETRIVDVDDNNNEEIDGLENHEPDEYDELMDELNDTDE